MHHTYIFADYGALQNSHLQSTQHKTSNMLGAYVDVSAGNLVVQSWFDCCLGCSVVWALLDICQYILKLHKICVLQECGLRFAVHLPNAFGHLKASRDS